MKNDPRSLEVSRRRVQQKSPQIFEEIKVDDLHFSQKNVSSRIRKREINTNGKISVTKGARLEVLSAKIKSGLLNWDAFPLVRVVYHEHKVWALDNRRVKIFKDAGVEKIRVEVKNFSELEIRKEFFDKLRPKSVRWHKPENAADASASDSSSSSSSDEESDAEDSARRELRDGLLSRRRFNSTAGEEEQCSVPSSRTIDAKYDPEQVSHLAEQLCDDAPENKYLRFAARACDDDYCDWHEHFSKEALDKCWSGPRNRKTNKIVHSHAFADLLSLIQEVQRLADDDSQHDEFCRALDVRTYLIEKCTEKRLAYLYEAVMLEKWPNLWIDVCKVRLQGRAMGRAQMTLDDNLKTSAIHTAVSEKDWDSVNTLLSEVGVFLLLCRNSSNRTPMEQKIPKKQKDSLNKLINFCEQANSLSHSKHYLPDRFIDQFMERFIICEQCAVAEECDLESLYAELGGTVGGENSDADDDDVGWTKKKEKRKNVHVETGAKRKKRAHDLSKYNTQSKHNHMFLTHLINEVVCWRLKDIMLERPQDVSLLLQINRRFKDRSHLEEAWHHQFPHHIEEEVRVQMRHFFETMAVEADIKREKRLFHVRLELEPKAEMQCLTSKNRFRNAQYRHYDSETGKECKRPQRAQELDMYEPCNEEVYEYEADWTIKKLQDD